ncbi:hypothetical protein Tco_1132726 [Tanacetum coccineum]|uniref:Uncharacterized protein n=1 Tax=Tanacetum coccineum TaxID=301880 RepID=A0ABQ5JE49_9ASTR
MGSVHDTAQIRRIFLDGYGILVFRIVIYKISSFKLQNTLFDVIKTCSQKPTASFCCNKKKGVEPNIEVSNANPFEVLNSVDNDVELGTNGGTTNLVNNGATSSGSSFMNVNNSSSSTTLIIDKIEKFEELLTSRQAILVDEAGNPLEKVKYQGDYDSEDEVASVNNDMARSMDSERVDPYDDDMYEGQDLPQEIQAICDNLDIRVRGRKKK